MTREIRPQSPLDLNVMRITVDGQPIDDPGRSSSDIQRCTDVALDQARIQFRFDNLESKPRLAVATHPVAVSMGPDGAPASAVHFRMYDNYASFLQRAEIRIFNPDQSLQAVPLESIPIDEKGLAEWQPAAERLPGPARELKFVLRAYDAKGHFDETEPHQLWLVRESDGGQPAAGKEGAAGAATPPSELLAAYGESDLARHQIPLDGGTVRVQGGGIPAGHTVWVAGRQVPVDPQGNFVAEEILPSGAQTVEVAVLDDAGNGSVYLRDLEFKRRDLFYVGVADLTVSESHANGPVKLLQGENAPQPSDSSLDGRLAFYVNGKVNENWRLTTSADTREGPVKDLFSNFLDKSPDSLFRRVDPDYHYPTFGDDGSVEEMAPTFGKFYLKASRGENYGLWGNFKVGYQGNEMAQVDRGLYGANAHYASQATTRFGERKAGVDGFAAEPGTVPSFEELRGTGGSLYFLHHQDILTGSERVRIEIRDKDSHIVTGSVDLRAGIDYDIDYLQGRLLLSEPLSSTAADTLLVRTSGLSGEEAGAYRAETSIGCGDFFKRGKGRLTLYSQNRDAGYSAPNQSTLKTTEQYGGTFKMPVANRLTLAAKGDQSTEDQGLEHRTMELDVGYKLTDKWSLSTGVRNDRREDHSLVVPLTQEQGERTDAVVQVAFDPGTAWRADGFGQDTLSADAGRQDNRRFGAGGSYRLTKRFKLDGEVSDGDLGPGGRLGTSFLATERTNLYLNYLLENDRTDSGVPVRQSSVGTGVKQRLSDSSSVYLEERYHDAGSQSGLTHAAGVDLVKRERWNFGASAEVGTLVDAQTSAQTDRKAAGVRLGYNRDSLQLTSGIEYRRDDTEQTDTTQVERSTWLFRNSIKYQVTPDWRVIGKLNHSLSDSTLGDFYVGGYTEAVVGYAYRPVRNDRLNALAKYTYFYNVPTTGQVGAENTPSGFIQKSQIAAIDLTYDLTAAWSIGGKYAYRLGQVSLDRVNPVFFDNTAHLVVLRLDWRLHEGPGGLGAGGIVCSPSVRPRPGRAAGGLACFSGLP